jgi:hypothetical protein
MLDQILGENNCQNMIVWKRSHAHSDTKQGMSQFGRVCDYIFFYTGGSQWTFNPSYTTYDQEYLASEYRHKTAAGRYYKETDVTAAKPGGDTSYEWRVKRKAGSKERWIPDLDDEWRKPAANMEYLAVKPYDRRYWAYSKQNLIDFWKAKKLIHRSTGMPRLIQYADEMPGIPLQELWTDIPPISALAQERLGYPTQKPLALMNRIIATSSNPNDVVLDAFCGCGTTLTSAQNLGRQWIGIDVSPTACRVMAKRLRNICKLPENEELWRIGRGFVVRDLPWTVEKLKQLPPFEFENWAVIALGGIPNKVQVGDMGVDGRIYPVGTKPSDADSGGLFSDDWFPIQVKQTDKVGRPAIDAFEAVMEREGKGGRHRGFFVAFGYTADAQRECAAFHKRTGRIIKLLTVEEILDEEHVQKM